MGRDSVRRVVAALREPAIYTFTALALLFARTGTTAESPLLLDADFDDARRHSLTIQRSSEAVVEIDPTQWAKLSALALIERGEIGAAIDKLMDDRPETRIDPEYDALLAALFQRSARYEDAAAMYWSIVQDDPTAAAAWVGLGIANDSLHARTRARAAFERSLLIGNLNPHLSRYAERRIAELGEQ